MIGKSIKVSFAFVSVARVALAFIGFLFILGCTPKLEKKSSEQQSSAQPASKKEEALIVGTDATYAPFEFQTSGQEITGFEIELFREISKEAGLKIEFVNTPWEGLFTQLLNGDRDIVVSAVTITAERKKTLAFSDPYFEAKQLIAVSKGSTVQNFEALRDLKVAVQTATTGDEMLQKLFGKGHENLKRFESIPLALKELENGSVDAVVADNGVIMNYVKNNFSRFQLVEDKSIQVESYGFAFRPKDQELVAKVNDGLKRVKGNGTYKHLYEKYF